MQWSSISLLGSLDLPGLLSSQIPLQARTDHSCPSPGISCPPHLPSPVDACCLNYPSGHFLLTQFWDASPAIGPEDAWTIHGLWPDRCSGGFDAYCDNVRNVSEDELEDILLDASKSTHPDLLDYMSRMWLSYNHRDANLWVHEWNKHGTCVSTLEPQCYDADAATSTHQKDILDYFTHATNLFSSLDTFSLLEKQGIVPSYSRRYSLAELENAVLSSSHGREVTFRCNSRHELDEVWYHFNVRGPLRDVLPALNSSKVSIWIPTDPDGQISNCPQTGIKYLPKSKSSQPPVPSPPDDPGSGPAPTSTSTPFQGKGHLLISVLPPSSNPSRSSSPYLVPAPQTLESETGLSAMLKNPNQGCLIRSGVWYTSGACATYTAKSDIVIDAERPRNLFSLQSSFAPCAILLEGGRHGRQGEFVCAKNLPVQSIFSSVARIDGEKPESELGTDTTMSTPSRIELELQKFDRDDTSGTKDREGGKIVLAYRNSTVFYADKIPGRFEKVKIFADDSDGERDVRVEIHWEAVI